MSQNFRDVEAKVSVPAGMRSDEEREVDGAGRRVGVASAVTREGRGPSLSAATSQFPVFQQQ